MVEFQSGDPALAARIANAIADAYLRMQQSVRQDQTRGAGVWLANEIEKLRPKVAEAEAKAEAFRSRTNLFVGTNNTTLSNQQLGEFNSQLAAARGQKADAETRARIIRDMLRRGEPIESSDVVNSELIRRLSEQRVTLRAQLAEQSSTLLDGHPRIKELRAQIADLDRQIRAEAEKLIRSLENDARIATARVEALSQNLDVIKRQAATSNEQDVELRALEREAKAQRDLLESYLARYRETTARDTIGNAPPDAKIISQAVVSNTPAFPKKVPIVVVATLIAFVLSAGLVTTGELLRATAARPYRLQEPPLVDPAHLEADVGGDAGGHMEPTFEEVEAPFVAAEMTPPARLELDGIPTRKTAVSAATAPAIAAAEDAAPHPVLGVPLGAVRDVAKRLRDNVEAGRGIALFGAMADIPTALPALTLGARARDRPARRVDRARAALDGAGGDLDVPQHAGPDRCGARHRVVRQRDRQRQAVACPPHPSRGRRPAVHHAGQLARVPRHDGSAGARLHARHRRCRPSRRRLLPPRRTGAALRPHRPRGRAAGNRGGVPDARRRGVCGYRGDERR